MQTIATESAVDTLGPSPEACELLTGSCSALSRLAEDVEVLAQRVLHGEARYRSLLREQVDTLRRQIAAYEALRESLPGASGQGLRPLLRPDDAHAPDAVVTPIGALVLASFARQVLLEHRHELRLQARAAGDEAA